MKASWKLVKVPLGVVSTRLQISTSPTHSGGLRVGPSQALFELLFVFTMTLRALEATHLLSASSQF